MRIERIRTSVKHHNTVEKYMANRNINWMVFQDRWEGLSGAEGWDKKQTKYNYSELYRVLKLYIVCISGK